MNTGNRRITLFSTFLIFALSGRSTEGLLEHTSLQIKNIAITTKMFYEYSAMNEACRNNKDGTFPIIPINNITHDMTALPADGIFEFEVNCIIYTAQQENIDRVLVSLLMKYWSLKYANLYAMIWYHTEGVYLEVYSWTALYLAKHGLEIRLDVLIRALQERTANDTRAADVIKQVETSFKELELITLRVPDLENMIKTGTKTPMKIGFLNDEPITKELIQLDRFFATMLYDADDIKDPSIFYQNPEIKDTAPSLALIPFPKEDYSSGHESAANDMIKQLVVYSQLIMAEKEIDGESTISVLRLMDAVKDKKLTLTISQNENEPVFKFTMDA